MTSGNRPDPPPLCEAPRYLRALADAIDEQDDEQRVGRHKAARTVQRDLRSWADAIDALCKV